jgi:hypothetical protein
MRRIGLIPTIRALPLTLALASVSLPLGCDAEEIARSKAEEAKEALDDAVREKSEQAEKSVVRAADKAVQQSKAKADELAGRAADKIEMEARALWQDVPSTGELSETSRRWIEKEGERVGESVEGLLAKGAQLAPAAVEIGKTVNAAVEREVVIEPVIQRVDDVEASARIDRAVGDMPRVKTIDGLEIGFKRMSLDTAGSSARESAYLVLWRQDDHLLGFVYRSRREVDIESLIEETPRLIGLVRSAL